MKRPDRQAHPGFRRPKQESTAWDAQAAWYDRLVGEDGSDYHREVVLPGTIRMLGDLAGRRVLDLGCGQGVLCRLLLKEKAQPVGVDLSRSLIDRAKSYRTDSAKDGRPRHSGEVLSADEQNSREKKRPPARTGSAIEYRLADACNLPEDLRAGSFDAIVSVLAAGNMENLAGLFLGASAAARPGACFVVIVMHPCFRIPRQSRWDYDQEQKVQYRRVDRYLTPLTIPILTHPGRKDDTSYTTMFHRPIQDYVIAATGAGWALDGLEEWTSNRQSVGARAKAENRARSEFPLFLALRFRKA